MDKHKSIENFNSSGLDMEKTIEWYKISEIELPHILADLSHSVENQNLIGLSNNELGGLLSLFPKNARDRSILRKIIGQPTTWFHKNSTNEHPIPTTNRDNALSSTAIIPSYIDYTPWGELKTPTADIWIYQIPQNVIPENIRKIILSEGFIHEVGHSIVQPALYIDSYTLKFPDGKLISGIEALLHFAELAEQCSPISHYASTYRATNNKFESDKPNYNVKTAISEEMCETVAAYLLGFSYCGDNSRGKNPFADRPNIKDFVKNFLNAELIKT